MTKPRRVRAVRLLLIAGSVLTWSSGTVSAQLVGEAIGEGIVRFHASPEAKAGRIPSMALERERPVIAQPPADFGIAPVFGRGASVLHGDDRFVTTIEIEPGTSLYGTGQAAGPLLRNGRVTECWNYDAYGYDDRYANLYTSHPWVLAVRPEGSSFGVLADTTYRVEIDLTEHIVFRAAGREHPVIIIEGHTPQEVLIKLADLTGRIEMPPKWAVGYHQCRYSYNPDARVREVADTFRAKRIPADVIWMDIDYMDDFKVFTWDHEQFPDPAALNAYLDSIGFSNVWMIDPGVANQDGYFVHDSGNEKDVWVQRADGTEYTGYVWPGECVFPDYTNEGVREWWAGLYKDFMATGIDGVWNDMNEPAVFNVPTKTMPEDNLHRADPELGGPGPHARFHNVYGMFMVKASREGVMAANPDKRPFVLSRANFMGGHRYGATWTGDNTANWYHVDVSIPMMLNLSLSAQPFCGPDIGGFAGDGDGPMFARWMGFGALMPFARGHTAKGNIDKEPWAFGEQVEATSRRAIERRYRLMPLLYTLFEEAHRTGLPVARPLFFADPADPALRSEDDSFLLGDNLLVSAHVTPGRERVHILPNNPDGLPWREFDFPSFDGGRDSQDPDQPALFIRPGGIVPTGPVHQFFGDRPSQRDELTLIVYPDANGFASGELYEDAGEGWGFREGEFLRTRFTAEIVGDRLIVTPRTVEGGMPRPDRALNLRVLLPDGTELTASGRDGRPVGVTLPG
jgi:alpha-glucosidase